MYQVNPDRLPNDLLSRPMAGDSASGSNALAVAVFGYVVTIFAIVGLIGVFGPRPSLATLATASTALTSTAIASER